MRKDPTPQEIYEYVVDMLSQLVRLAREGGLEQLARPIEEVVRGADSIVSMGRLPREESRQPED